MSSIFTSIEMGKRGLTQQQNALQVTGHNLMNASNKSYTRQKVTFSTLDPLYRPQLNRGKMAGQIGQGSQISEVKRVQDELLQGKIIHQNSQVSFYSGKYNYLQEIEKIIGEPNGEGLSAPLEEFIQSWNDAGLDPHSLASREGLVTSAANLLSSMKQQSQDLATLENHVNESIHMRVQDVNRLLEDIAHYSLEIQKSRALNDNPNDLLDKRDLAIESLSKLIDIETIRQDQDEIFIHSKGNILVQGGVASPIKEIQVQGKNYISFQGKEIDQPMAGEIKSLLDIRDEDIADAKSQLNRFALHLTTRVNGIHRQGFGLSQQSGLDFFEIPPLVSNASGNYDQNGDGQIDSTRIFSVVGTESLPLERTIGESGILSLGKDNTGKDILISYQDDDTVSDVIQAINSSPANIVANLNAEGKLTLSGIHTEGQESVFHLSHLEDSGVFLTEFAGILSQRGRAGAFDANRVDQRNQFQTNQIQISARENLVEHLSIARALVENPQHIALRSGKDIQGDNQADIPRGSGNGDLAFQVIAELTSSSDKDAEAPFASLQANMPHMEKYTPNLREFLHQSVAYVGEKAKLHKEATEQSQAIATGFANLKQTISGVNTDEELVNLIQYQRGYQSSAKLIDITNQLLDVLMNIGHV